MSFTTLISPKDLFAHLEDPTWVILDCRFSLNDTERGRRDYAESHIPHALYAHLDEDLSGLIVPGKTGRHPLPEIEVFSSKASAWGVGAGVQVVAYDDMGGGMAARLWWLLRWLGHTNVAVLDGGWPAWLETEYPVGSDLEEATPRVFRPHPQPELVASAQEVEARRLDPDYIVLDARMPERYRGEVEPLDPVAGHIPGAFSAPFSENLDDSGCFLSSSELRTRFARLLGDRQGDQVISYCGSGVTAAHNVLALSHAGYANTRLYPGSWSHWITDPTRPVAVNSE